MRLKELAVESLNPEQKALHDKIQQGPRGAGREIGMIGPFGVWVRAPRIGDAVQQVGAVARFETSLPEAVKEVAICTVGVHFRAKFEFSAHRRLAMRAGVDEAILDAIYEGETPSFTDEGQQVAYEMAHQLLNDKRIGDETYVRASRLFDETALIELVSIMGYYCCVSLTLNAFEVPVPSPMPDPWPELP